MYYEPPMDDMSCIVENGSVGSIYLGNIESASSLDNLKRYRIKGILSICMNKIPFEIQTQLQHYLHIYLEDCETENISRHFDQSNQFIDRARQSGNVLIHCMAGISRSATLVAAYLMKNNNMSTQDALKLLERKRWQVYPNNGFLRQLQNYERQLNQSKNDQLFSPLKESLFNKQYQTPTKEISFMNKNDEQQQFYSSGQKTRPLDEFKFDHYKRKSLNNDEILNTPTKQQLTFQRPSSALKTTPDLIKKKNFLQETINGNNSNNNLKKDGLAALALELNNLDWQSKKQDFESKYKNNNNNTKSFINNNRPLQLNQHQSKLDELLNAFNRKPIL